MNNFAKLHRKAYQIMWIRASLFIIIIISKYSVKESFLSKFDFSRRTILDGANTIVTNL